jgi:hypothetical protein
VRQALLFDPVPGDAIVLPVGAAAKINLICSADVSGLQEMR